MNYDGKIVDVASVTRHFTLDVRRTIAFGRPFGFMDANEHPWKYNQTSFGYLQNFELHLNHLTLGWLFSTRAVEILAPIKLTDRNGMGLKLKYAREAVSEEYRPETKVEKNVPGHFVSKELSQVQCVEEANLQILAGSDDHRAPVHIIPSRWNPSRIRNIES